MDTYYPHPIIDLVGIYVTWEEKSLFIQ
jgi:hypothetical protein